MNRKKVDHFPMDKRELRQRASRARKAFAVIYNVFAWDESKEGIEYWSKIAARFEQVAWDAEQALINPTATPEK